MGHDIKVMKRIETRELAIEGVITRHGTLVGPLMTELTGLPRAHARTTADGAATTCRPRSSPRRSAPPRATRTKAMGERLRQEGYRGYFELDFLLDADTGEMWLGELNPRVTGASSITNVTAVAYGDMPLFLFHLLEFMDVDYVIDVDELNERWAHPGARGRVDAVHPEADGRGRGARSPTRRRRASGAWAPDRTISYARRDTDWHTIGDPGEAFYLRIAATGGFRYPGADLGILVTRGRFMNDEHELQDRARHWITGIKDQFHSVPFAAEQRPEVEPEPFGFKML